MIGSKVTSEQLQRDLEEFPVRLRDRVSKAVKAGLAIYERHHKTEEIRRGGGKSKAVPEKFTWRTGELAKSYRIYWRTGDLDGYYGSEKNYSKIIEQGGTVRPRTGKFLAIPLEAARYGVGGGLSPRRHRGLFAQTSKKGNLLLFKNDGGGLVPMFLLKDKVKIGARPTIKRTEEKNRDKVHRRIADASIEPLGGK